MLTDESLSLICQLEQTSEQELVVDGKLLDEIEKNKMTLAKILKVCNSEDQIEAINLFVIEHTERPGRIQEMRKQRLSEKEDRDRTSGERRAKSARTHAAKTKSSENLSSSLPPQTKPRSNSYDANNNNNTSSQPTSTLSNIKQPCSTPFGSLAGGNNNNNNQTTTSTTSSAYSSSSDLSTLSGENNNNSTTQPQSKPLVVMGSTSTSSSEIKQVSSKNSSSEIKQVSPKVSSFAIPKLEFKSVSNPVLSEQKPKQAFNLNLGSLNENVDFEVTKEDLAFLRDQQPMTPTRAKLEREAKKMHLQAQRETRVLSARGERPKEGANVLFSPRVHLTAEVLNKKLRDLNVSIRVEGSEGSVTRYRIKPLNFISSEIESLKPEQILEAKQKIRHKLLSDFLTKEEHYIANMLALNEGLIKPILTEKILTESEIYEIFSNFSDLFHFHKSFVVDLKHLLSKWDSNPNQAVIGDIFLNHVALFRAYEAFAEDNVGSCLMKLSRAQVKNPKLESLIKEFEVSVIQKSEFNKDVNNGFSNIQDFVHAPFNRLSQYIHMIQLFEKYTPLEHSDNSMLKYNISQLLELSNEINTSINVVQVGNLNKQNELISAIAGAEHLALSERKLIKEGGMIITQSPSNSKMVLGHFYYFFLFNDILVCCSLMKNKEGKQFEHKETVKLTDIQSVVSKDDKHFDIVFISGDSWTFENRNSKDKDSWQSFLESSCKK